MKKPVRFCLSSILLAASCASAESYVVGVENLPLYAPHFYFDDDGQYRGFARELLDAFAAESGVTLQYRALTPVQLIEALREGKIDFKYPDSPHWAVEEKAGLNMHYSAPVVAYVDGVLVAPKRQGMKLDDVRQLAMVEGWTPRGYEERIASEQIRVNYSNDLRQMIRQALKKDTDGAYFNVVVATHYLDNVRASPGALVFDPTLPHVRGSFHLSSSRHPEVIARFDRFLREKEGEVLVLKQRHRVEANLDSEYMGMEQWKVDFLERQKARAEAREANLESR